MRFRKLAAHYLAFVASEHSPATLKGYAYTLRALAVDLGDEPVKRLKSKRMRTALDRRRLKRNGEPVAPDTWRLALVSFEQLQKWAISNRYIRKPWLKPIRKPPGRRRERLPTRPEVAAILRAASPRFRRVLQLLRLTGARPCELAAATIDQYERAAGVIVLEQHKTAKKTGVQRRIGVGRRATLILRRLIGDRTSGNLLLRDNGRPWTSEGLSKAYSRVRDRLGLSKRLVLYLTRHEAGTTFCRELGLRAAAHALGHRDYKTTARYDHPTDAELARYQDEVRRRP